MVIKMGYLPLNPRFKPWAMGKTRNNLFNESSQREAAL
jgi:hypothetical protein